jgi:hypothetical protein
MYCIREAPRAWNVVLTKRLISYGFKQSLIDRGIYAIIVGILLFIFVVYVDDSILVGKDGEFIPHFMSDLAKRLKIEDLGPATWLLGCSIERDREHMILRIS